MSNNFVFLITILVVFLVGCSIEEANQSDKNELIIASDYLKSNDTTLFRTFSKTNNIRIKIKFLSSDAIRKSLQKDGFDSNFDLVFVKSLQSVKNLKSIEFHHLSRNIVNESLTNFRAFQNNSWFAVGLDPYVFSFVPDTLRVPTSYKDLTKNFKYSCLNPNENAVFLANLKYLSKKKPNNYLNLKKSFEANLSTFNKGTDSLPSRQFLLLKWSQYLENPILKKNKKRTINYTLDNSALYADRKCIAVVLEAKNFKNACLFLSFLDTKNKSALFCERMGAVPILPKNKTYEYDKIRGMEILMINEDSLLMNL
jgi:hypothetical protein